MQMSADEQQDITDKMTLNMIRNHQQESSDDKYDIHQKKITHSGYSIEKKILTIFNSKRRLNLQRMHGNCRK